MNTLPKIDFHEAIASQLPSIEMLVALGYAYISKDEANKARNNDMGCGILRSIARAKMSEINSYERNGTVYKFTETDVTRVVDELSNVPFSGIRTTAQEIYHSIMPKQGGKSILLIHGNFRTSKDIKFIDFDNIENNVFHVTSEFEMIELPFSGVAFTNPLLVEF